LIFLLFFLILNKNIFLVGNEKKKKIKKIKNCKIKTKENNNNNKIKYKSNTYTPERQILIRVEKPIKGTKAS
jgi:hypothetical protein